MNTILIYILESTICLSVFYLLFRLLMRKEASFAINRATLLTIVAASVIVPLVQLPQLMQTPVHVELIPDFSENRIQIQNLQVTENATVTEVQPTVSSPTPIETGLTIPLETLLKYFYFLGVVIALLLFIQNMIRIYLLSRKATVKQRNGYRLLIVDREVPSFAFGCSVVISQTDYDAHGPAILAHEQAHIRLNHFVDLLLLELVKAIHWFNPAVYALIGDLKEIHEFQADEQTLHSGIDAKQYQLLIIQKGVGPRRFALANSFNHCQIKKRIIMMNKSKTSKAWRWKVATFLPLLALLLMAFGNRSEKVNLEKELSPQIISINVQDSLKKVNKAEQAPPPPPPALFIEIRKDGNYLDNKLCSVEEIGKKAEMLHKKYPDVMARLKVESDVPMSRVTEVKEVLRNSKLLNINYSTITPDDKVYPANDVTEKAKFPNGEWSQWIGNQLKHLIKAKPVGWEYTIKYSIIIDKTGKVRDGQIIKGCDYPEINTEFKKILTQAPDWIPARKNGVAVNVMLTEAFIQKVAESK